MQEKTSSFVVAATAALLTTVLSIASIQAWTEDLGYYPSDAEMGWQLALSMLYTIAAIMSLGTSIYFFCVGLKFTFMELEDELWEDVDDDEDESDLERARQDVDNAISRFTALRDKLAGEAERA